MALKMFLIGSFSGVKLSSTRTLRVGSTEGVGILESILPVTLVVNDEVSIVRLRFFSVIAIVER